MRSISTFLLLVLSIVGNGQTPSELSTVRLVATVTATPPRITLQWDAQPPTTSFTIYRRPANSAVWGSPLATLPLTTTQYADATVQVGVAYEYKVLRNADTPGFGYLRTGVEVPAVEQRGTMVLLVEASIGQELQVELQQLGTDLLGDGWMVARYDVEPNADPADVRALVQAEYAIAANNVKAVFIVGHVPVPYSGNIYPDGHLEHQGAWPCDGYYGEMNGTWTDVSVDQSVGNWVRNYNVPGDGKFDQSDFPSQVELQVGRVDLSNLGAFPSGEVQLMSTYLNKAHEWKTRGFDVPKQGTVWDNLAWVGSPLAFSGFAGVAPCVGLDALTMLDVQDELSCPGIG